MLSCPRALVIRGVEGDPELSIGNSTRLLELKDERITPFTFQPKDAGLADGDLSRNGRVSRSSSGSGKPI